MIFVDIMPYLLLSHSRCDDFQLCKHSLVHLLSSEYCKGVFCCPEFEPYILKIMAGPSKIMRLDDEEICDELWNEDEFSDDSDCDSDTVVKFLSGTEQSDNSDDKDNVNYDSDMQHGTWTRKGLSNPNFI
jgi:hypothetical protein